MKSRLLLQQRYDRGQLSLDILQGPPGRRPGLPLRAVEIPMASPTSRSAHAKHHPRDAGGARLYEFRTGEGPCKPSRVGFLPELPRHLDAPIRVRMAPALTRRGVQRGRRAQSTVRVDVRPLFAAGWDWPKESNKSLGPARPVRPSAKPNCSFDPQSHALHRLWYLPAPCRCRSAPTSRPPNRSASPARVTSPSSSTPTPPRQALPSASLRSLLDVERPG